jgi:hypothetical protein
VIIGTLDDISGDLLFIDAIDLDQDGDKDILMVAATGMVWFEQSASLNFEKAVKINATDLRPSSVEVDDINMDGYPDIVLGTFENVAGAVNGNAQLCLGSAEGPMFFKFVSNDEGVHRVAFARVTDDETPEIIYIRGNAMYWVEFLADSSFAHHYIDGAFGINNKLIVRDVDGDGDEDIITFCGNCFAPVSNQDNRISYYINGSDFGSNLTCPEGSIYLETQSTLDEYQAQFGGCKTITGDLYLGTLYDDWSDITSLEPLTGIEKVEGNLYIWYNNGIDDFSGLDSLTSIGGSFLMDGFKSTTLNGLHNLETIGGDLSMRNVFTNAFGVGKLGEMESLELIGGNIHIYQSRIESINWPSFDQDTIYGDINISWLSGPPMEMEFLKQVEVIQGSLIIEDTQLDGLSDLSHIKKIEQDLSLHRNNYIYSLDTLHEALVVDSIWSMFGNPFLNFCNVIPLCNHIKNGKPTSIGGNGDNCRDIDSIICSVNTAIKQLDISAEISVYPQPAQAVLNIDISNNLLHSNAFKYRLTDLSGRLLRSGNIIDKASISLHGISSGLYLLDLIEAQNRLRFGVKKVLIE